MGKIKILPDNLVSKIAAGEIVERPASVVKELLENSIDAGSTQILIELESGGKKLIRVSDDGSGMTRDESLLSLERHATSKIGRIEDLLSVSSLGFRGEAIPSIASVSRFRMTTKTPGDVVGTAIKVEGGVLRGVEETGAAGGTTVEVKNLFYNTPPRLKFMRKIETELSNVMDVVQREALPLPKVGFELKHGGKTILRLPPRESLSERISEIYPRSDLHEISARSEGAGVSGFMSSPLDTRSNTQKLYTYVNGRSVRDRFLTRMVMDSYGKMLEKGKFPQGAVFVEVPSGDVDVNVHPTKNEIRFRNSRLVADLIREAVTGMLENAPWLKSYDRKTESSYGERQAFKESGSVYGDREFSYPKHGGFESAHDLGFIRSEHASVKHGTGDREPLNEHEQGDSGRGKLFPGAGRYSDLHILGQLGELYIVCASGHGMILIDQHAAHERINYERIKKGFEGAGRPESQELLVSEVVELSPHEADILGRYADGLEKLGLKLEAFGDNSFIIRSVPAVLKNIDFTRLVKDIVAEIADSGREDSLSESIDRVIATMACHSSIRASHELSMEKMRALLAELDRAKFPHSCPHGRPVARELTFSEIERMFKRT
jgi:DNA mismatch repair protein MutL